MILISALEKARWKTNCSNSSDNNTRTTAGNASNTGEYTAWLFLIIKTMVQEKIQLKLSNKGQSVNVQRQSTSCTMMGSLTALCIYL